MVGQDYATVTIKKNYKIETIVLKSGLAWQVNLRLELGWVEKKTGKEKTRWDPADQTGWSDDLVDPAMPCQKPGCNPFTFVFFILKWCRFDFFKKNWSDQNPESRPGLKTTMERERKRFPCTLMSNYYLAKNYNTYEKTVTIT